MTSATVTAFDQLALNKNILKVLDEVGYETPSPIQAQTIPLMLEGKDLVGQAQTGTGKTAAFALPILSNLDLKQKQPQVLVLAPTRELAIQVAEAFQKYATHLKGFHVLPVYGGQDYRTQIRALERGVHVVVGTPGRVMDHMRKGKLNLDKLTTLVLDEADEMLRMGFIDDVEWVLEQSPDDRQIALFSATMPDQIRRIANRHLNKPAEVTIKLKTMTAETIRQRFWPVGGVHKLDALTRILEAESFDAMLVFVRTKTSTIELAEKLEARGFASAALNGDIQQKQRERTVENLKKGKLDILVATDVAARGLDVERISHVVNYDIPYDTEAYVHRIGRTGRAGREGDAILFVAPRERRMLQAIERATHKKIEMMELPSTDLINNRRIEKFKQRITDTLADKQLGLFKDLVEQYQLEHETPIAEIAAALAKMIQGEAPFLLQNKPNRKAPDKSWDRDEYKRDNYKEDRKPRRERGERDRAPEQGMQRFRIEVGHDHKVKPGNIVGAIANEADIESKYIGRINIFDDHSLVDLPEGMPKELLKALKKTRVMGQALQIAPLGKERSGSASKEEKPRKEKPQKTRVKKRARDKDKGKPKRARNKER
ncbi:MAG: DEAD/DEAH box helicase [Gammaproteobacteria bacterium]|nr:DEAD/DEAH box helicase [Gammaproteobacteria bacterium]